MNYLTHFGLREPPFGITPDTSFFFGCTSSRMGLNTLLVAVGAGEGFIKVTGEVGTGKTLLCRMLLSALDERRYRTAYIHNPNLEPRTLFLAIADELELRVNPKLDQHHMLREIALGLINAARAGQRVVLCLDEVQAMPIETLESLRLLTNLETEKRKLIQVVLFGQPELDEKLAQNRIRQLRQRVTFQHVLKGLTAEEVGFYLRHRLEVAGYRGPPVFSSGAVRVIHAASRGTPRLVNILANKALMLAYGRGRLSVTWSNARDAVADTPATLGLARWGWLQRL